ncbi:MAG: hypothetical protein K0V04_42360 [Deltaproteobacteria bacterium]|nr:hypothetical protein [Deltaproteobacteria bacterium]
MRRTIVASLGLALTLTFGCKPPATGPLPLCSSEVEGGEASETQSNDVPPEIWFTIILKSFNLKTGEVTRPTLDCTSKPLEVQDEEVALCIRPENPSPALPPRALNGDEDLELIGLEEGKALVWVRTEYFENGDALGPIAVAEYRKNGIAVRAIGPLRANPNRVRMRLEQMGETSVLVVESMVCPPEDTSKCARVMRIIPHEGSRFVERPLLDDETDECLGAATFPLSHWEEIEREDGIIRRFELVRTIKFDEGAVVVNEQVTIKDIDPEQPDAPPAVFRKAQIERALQLEGGGIRTTQPLWERMMAEHGSVQVKAHHPDGKGKGKDEETEAGEDAAEAEAAG